MQKWTKTLISIPVIAAPWLMAATGNTQAEVRYVGPAGAVKLLAQSKTVNARCKHLSASEKLELSDYTAKAEIAVAAMQGASVAQNARRAGVSAGKTMTCGRDSEELVRASLDAARRAMTQARNSSAKQQQHRRRKRQVKIKPAPDIRQSLSPQTATTVTIPKARISKNTGSLTRYRRITAAYYLERRCQHLPPRQAVAFWRQIVVSHKAVLKKYSSAQVARAKNEAEAIARRQGACNSATRKIVMAGYKGVRY